jgi:LmbE family N-acetylglucosaminyl deacetylase
MSNLSLRTNAVIRPEGVALADYAGQPNVAVIAPHPDDDAIGVGGSLLRHRAAGENVFAIYVTDGAGTPTSGGRTREEIVQTRQDEAMRGLGEMDGQAGIFLNYPSKAVRSERVADVVHDLGAIFDLLRPRVIYVTAPYERHSTHVACTLRTVEAIRAVEGFTPELKGYAVWGYLYGDENLEYVDITAHVDAKRRAIRCHESEVAGHAYDDGIIGFHRYAAVFQEAHGLQEMAYAELLLDMSRLVREPDLSVGDFARQQVTGFLERTYGG